MLVKVHQKIIPVKCFYQMGHGLNNFSRGLPNDVIYQIQKLMALWLNTGTFFKVSLNCPNSLAVI